MSKSSQRRRKDSIEKIKKLESSLGLVQRFKGLFQIRRVLRGIRKYSLHFIALCLLIFAARTLYQDIYQTRYKDGITHVDYDSRHMIPQQDLLALLGLTSQSNLDNVDCEALKAKLCALPYIEDARISKSPPGNLHIVLKERLPLCYVQMESDYHLAQRPQALFMDHRGTLFPVIEKYHQDYLDSPTWLLQADEIESFQVGAQIESEHYGAIVELIALTNRYELQEIPRVKEIFRPKVWKILLSLESGAEVMMKSNELELQVDRLYKILEHARITNKQVRSANVIPELNPSVTYFDEEAQKTP